MSGPLAGAFLLLACACGLAAASGRGWPVRLAVLAACPLLALVVYWQLQQRDGWPRPGKPPVGSVFVAAIVDEPTQTSGGAIYLWVSTSSGTPRAYRMPYSRQLHKQIQAASRQSQGGQPVTVGRSDRQKSGVRFYRSPPGQLPLKTAAR